MLINELNYENVNAYLYWNGVWPIDDGNCLIEIGGFYPNDYVKRRGNHYIMMHFSKFIKNGYTRVDTSLNASQSNVTGFISPDEDELVLVISNSSEMDETLKLDIGDEYKIRSGKIYRSTKNTDDFNKEEELNEYMVNMGSLKTYEIEVPSDTLTTLVMKIEPRNPEAVSEEEEDKEDKESEQEEEKEPVSITDKYLKEYWSLKGLKY